MRAPALARGFLSSTEAHYNSPVTKRKDDASDEGAFADEMADVIPLPPDPRGRSHFRPSIKAPPPPPSPSIADDEGGSDEDFVADGVDRREIRKLKRGDYVAAVRRDLHGMTAADACASAGRFIENSRHDGHRCVCIVHGRGSHSEGNMPVLRARVRAYLRTHRWVLAYADAPSSCGGAGAVYILLRK